MDPQYVNIPKMTVLMSCVCPANEMEREDHKCTFFVIFSTRAWHSTLVSLLEMSLLPLKRAASYHDLRLGVVNL